jgi:hypothetical protein
MTLWESGECDTDAVAKDGTTILLLRSRVLSSPMLVAAVADDLVDHVLSAKGAIASKQGQGGVE